nr:MAG TPA: hypothetical protein [Caudoviricetes sp.]
MLRKEGDVYVTSVCELVVLPLIVGTVSGVTSAYLVRFFDKHKNDRHQ